MTSQPGPLLPLPAADTFPHAAFLAKLLGIAMLLAALLNGASFYLKRTGLSEAQAYQTYWRLHCEPVTGLAPITEPGPRCCAAKPAQLAYAQTAAERQATRYLYDSAGGEIAFKLAKDLVFIATLLLSMYCLARGAAPFPDLARQWPIWLLAGYLLLACAIAWWSGASLAAAAGARAFMFLAVALAGAWLAPRLAAFAGAIGVLLLIEAMLLPYEVYHGAHVYGHFGSLPYAGRAAGTFILPNSLGIFAAAGLAFYHAFGSRQWLAPVGIASLALVLAGGSGTGLACTLVFWALVLLRRAGPGKRMRIAGPALLVAVATAFSLPALTGRPLLYDSLFGEGGRAQTLHNAVGGQPLQTIAFGRGLGVNTNTDLNLGKAGDVAAVLPRPADSTITGLIIQIGVLGTLLFYLILAWAAYRDARTRIFYAVLAAASLTLNITELFPVNFLLGIALAHSVVAGGQPAARAP